MSRRFVVAIQGIPAPVANAVTKQLQASGLGFWHWMENVWLVTAAPSKGEVTAKSLSDWLAKTPGVPQGRMLVIRADSDSTEHWGIQDLKSWNWFTSEWK